MMASFDLEPDDTSKTVLVVDDMEANRSVLCRQLEMHNYAAISVDSGEAALEFLSRSRPDMVLLDYMMPNMNGIEVLKALRSDPATADLPIIMVTARAESEATVEALEAGADDYVTKPIDFSALRARIESHLAKRGDTSDLRRCNAVLDERMTMRGLVLADMETELRNEIGKRKDLEARLNRSAAQTSSDQSLDQAQLTQLREIGAKFDLIFNSVVEGKTPNMAQMFELKGLIAEVLDKDEDPDQVHIPD